MKTFPFDLLAETVKKQRKAKGMTQAELSEATGMNRSMIGQMEKRIFKPSIERLEALGRVLEFDVSALYLEKPKPKAAPGKVYNIAVAGTGYVGLSIATLLAQHNHVTAADFSLKRWS